MKKSGKGGGLDSQSGRSIRKPLCKGSPVQNGIGILNVARRAEQSRSLIVPLLSASAVFTKPFVFCARGRPFGYPFFEHFQIR